MLPATTWHYRGRRCRCRSMGGRERGRRRRRGGRGGGGGGGAGELYYGAGRKVQCVCLQKSPVPQISGAWRLKAEGRQTQQSRGDLGQSRLASPATSALELIEFSVNNAKTRPKTETHVGEHCTLRLPPASIPTHSPLRPALLCCSPPHRHLLLWALLTPMNALSALVAAIGDSNSADDED